MSIAAAVMPNHWSIITIAAAGRADPAWNTRMRWPVKGDDHVVLHDGERRSLWAAQLDAAVMRADRTVLLVAEGLGCHAASWWARLSPASYVSRIAGALLFDPPADGGAEDDEIQDRGQHGRGQRLPDRAEEARHLVAIDHADGLPVHRRAPPPMAPENPSPSPHPPSRFRSRRSSCPARMRRPRYPR